LSQPALAGKVEGPASFARCSLTVPLPAFDCFEAFNTDGAVLCRKRFAEHP